MSLPSVRTPVVAGQFYPGDAGQLSTMVNEFIGKVKAKAPQRTLLAMAPHAGFIYSGAVAGMTLGAANLPSTLVLLGPNHTGMGQSLAVWSTGEWQTPAGSVPVAEDLAAHMLAADHRLQADTAAHLREHSLEVELPFLQALNSNVRVVPMAVAEPRLDVLLDVGRNLGGLLNAWREPVGIVVSSDMSHYVSHDNAKQRDSLALEQALALNPKGLFETVRREGISMCGVLPMTLGLAAALEMGAQKADLVAYATSGEVSGDFDQVVGYAGVLVS